MTVIKTLFASKKFWLTLLGSVLVGALHYFGASQEIITTIAGLFGINVLGQGLADFGKNQPK